MNSPGTKQLATIDDGDCYRATLPCFPPPRDFPVVVSRGGDVISRYGDDCIDYSVYAGRSLVVSFVDTKRTKIKLDYHHYELLRVCVAYYQFKYKKRLGVRSIADCYNSVKKVMSFCIERSVKFDQLYRYPTVYEKFPLWLRGLSKDHALEILSVLSDLYAARDVLGFYVLDWTFLLGAKAYVNNDALSCQTPYIPERIWLYQINRIEYFLDEFIKHRLAFVRMYLKALNAYLVNLGSIERACRSGSVKEYSPFRTVNAKGKILLGSFSDFAKQYGVLETIKELIYESPDRTISHQAGAKPFGWYFNAISFLAQTFLIIYSGMRISEAARLRVGCFEVDRVDGDGKVFFLRGETTKTLSDANAVWITSPVASKAIEVLTVISKLRMRVMQLDSRINVSEYDLLNPYLVVYGVEPWLPSKTATSERDINIRSWRPYAHWKNVCPGAFSVDELRITKADLQEVLEVSPELDPEIFFAGNVWPLAYHQLRRTLNVNAARYGVSIFSRQYQMKHQYQSMSTYYGRGFSDIALSKDVQYEFIEEVYRQLALSLVELEGDDYFSILKDGNKERLVSLFSSKDFDSLLKEVKKGRLRIRRTLLGVCMSKNFCSLGSAENIADCTLCHDALVDKRSLPRIVGFLEAVEIRLRAASPNTPNQESLFRQRDAAIQIIEAINVR